MPETKQLCNVSMTCVCAIKLLSVFVSIKKSSDLESVLFALQSLHNLLTITTSY